MAALGGLLILVGLVGWIASLVALVRPIAKIGLGTRKRAALGLVASVIVMGLAVSLLPAEGTATTSTSSTAQQEEKGQDTVPLGQAMNVGDAALTVEKVETRERVGIAYGSKARMELE